ncbi:sensor histidine kinase [Roseococcus sp.]|uniref:sensor histidine kinase n=1 Tax=Roseococcus sp. TaxID=2109646 RepID=UPI003BAB2100
MSLIAKFAGRPRGLAIGLAVGLAAFAVAFVVRWVSGIQGAPFATFFLAIFFTTVFSGWRPAAAISALSVVTAWYFFLEPQYSFELQYPQGPIALGLFVLVAIGQMALVEVLHVAALRLVTAHEKIEKLLAHERHLYRELQHRVANGIQSLATILSIQSLHMADMADAEAALADAVQRLRGMATVHRRLRDPELAGERLAQALDALTLDLLRAAGREDIAVEVVVQAPPLDHNAATLAAMIIAEAVMNSVKHAFAGRPGGTLTIALRQVGQDMVLTIGDDGHGLSGVLQDRPRLGTIIMEDFAQRLGGTLRLENAPGGARVIVNFPPSATQLADAR